MDLNLALSETTKGNESVNQKSKKVNLKMFYYAREKVIIKLFGDYTAILYKAEYEAKHGK